MAKAYFTLADTNLAELMEGGKIKLPPLMQRFRQEMEFLLKDERLCFTVKRVDDEVVFVDPTTVVLWKAFQRGWSSRIRVEPGVFILAKMTSDGIQFAENPTIMKTSVALTKATEHMLDKSPGVYVHVCIPKYSIQHAGTKMGVRQEDFERLRVTVRPNG